MKYYILLFIFILASSCSEKVDEEVNINTGNIIEEPVSIDQYNNVRVIWDEKDTYLLEMSKIIDSRGVAVFTIDSCEYIYFNLYGSSECDFLHKPQCSHCKKLKNESIPID